MSRGFTLIETLLSLMVVSVSIMLFSMILHLVVKNEYVIHTADDEKNIHQMRLLFVLSKNYEINGDMLYFRYLDNDMNFYYNGEKLILEEGYQVFFNNLTQAYFSENDHCYYFHYQRANQSEIRKRVIGCE